MRLLALLLLCLGSVLPVQAVEFELESVDQVVYLHGAWRFRAGDDPSWADPSYNHGPWDNILVPRDWRRQGHEDLTGFAWYRAELHIPGVAEGRRDSLHRLGISLGKIHSAYELYLGGIMVGGVGSFPPNAEPISDRERTYSIPPEAVDDSGKLLVAVRVWRHPTLGNSSTSGMFQGNYAVGPTFELMKRIWFKEAVALMLVISYLGFGAYHLYLFARNRKLPEFLWFGIVACMVAVYTLEMSQWKHVVGWLNAIPYLVHKKFEYGIIYLMPALGLELLCCLLRIKPSQWARAYQSGFALFSLLALLVPGYDILTNTLFLWQLYVIPGLFATLVLVVWYAARGNAEARTMTVGWAVFMFCALNDIVVAQGAVQHPRLLSIGFAAILVSMAISLANRFTRMYSQLDGEFRRRTRELEQTNEKLAEAARMDTLTGLLNRRGFAEKVDEEIARAGRSGRGFVVMMADIDCFKACNDQHGHAAGDFALQRVAELLSGQLRDVDTIARWGGEEFIFLLPETDLQGGATLAEELRTTLECTLFHYENSVLSLSITIGAAAYSSGMCLEDCVARADAALYAGKQAGRNCVVLDGDDAMEVAGGLPSTA
ncbi:MAG: diguanylate cyclase [Halieaceae bacterium]|nr:diguanylate cyclase [Halieaceae bacterium]